MKALVHAEVLKLRNTRTPAWLLLATLALVALTVAVNVPKACATNPPLSLDDPRLLAGMVGISFGVPEVMVLLLGVLALSQEFRYGTATSTYLVEPPYPRSRREVAGVGPRQCGLHRRHAGPRFPSASR